MLDFLKGAANLLAGPMSTAVDFAGNALGLPPLITNSIKAAAGAATGNVMLAASGAMGVAQELSKNPPAKTEYHASSSGSSKAGSGYAPSASSSPILNPGSSPLDPKMLDYADALKVLEANFQQLDLLDGKKNGSLSKKDLQRISTDSSLSPQLRDAARFMVENTALFERLDRQGPLARIGVFSPLYNLDTFSVQDLQRELKAVDAEFARYGRPVRPGSGGTTPPGTGGTSGGGGSAPVSGSPPTSAPSPLDPDFHEYHDALRVLSANWDTFDTAVGARDNVLTRDNLDAILNSPGASSTLKRAAQFFKDHPAYYDRLEMAAGVGPRDGIVGRPDVTAALRQADAAQASSGTQPASGAGGSRPVGGTSSNVRSIVDNPNMSIEDKIQAILMSISSDTDEEILDVMEQMANVRDQRASLGNGEADRKAGAKLESSMQELELRLQRLVEKRKAMFDLMSNMSSKFHEMAKTAISNLRSA
ncbi:hypothetical protein [Myxococcus virescens]|uniref:Uncharacterized protein n=1 Tax=Myxococcus virescens TaxID=83456 RepID=A0A511HE23_9BACT|nr:hypothetical protein [Myxococcus virescens]GEL71806.1 hypothetical protein MVI01_35900 [Myxococcus virescens]SDE15267.1 hypothetical protein SAMN04488504_104469 [Myxococcus virescens]